VATILIIFLRNNCLVHSKGKVEIWGRAQHEAARRRKSDEGLIQGGGKIYLVAKSRLQLVCWWTKVHEIF